MSNSTHRVNVVRLGEFTPHPNADTLDITMIGGYQLVVKRGNYKTGDLALYIQPDTIVPVLPQFDFLWEGRTLNADGTVPQSLRRITVKNIRKQWSEGLLMPVSAFADLNFVPYTFEEGNDVAEALGFTHYVDPEPVENINSTKRSQYQFPPKTLKGWYYWFLRLFGISKGYGGGVPVAGPKTKFVIPVYDVEGFKNFSNAFAEGDTVIVTEKIHGSNARYMFDGKTMWAGSKNLWKAADSKCIWRRALQELPWIEEWCRANPLHTLYAEIVPTQKGYAYGTNRDTVPTKVFGFDVMLPTGLWMNKGTLYDDHTTLTLAPLLYRGPFNRELLNKMVDGHSMVLGSNHIREGVVVSSEEEREPIRGLGRFQLKVKSMKFLESEGKNA